MAAKEGREVMSGDNLYTMKEAARYLGIGVSALTRATTRGKLPTVKENRRIYYALASLEEYKPTLRKPAHNRSYPNIDDSTAIPHEIHVLAQTFQAFAHPTRICMLYLLLEHGDLAAKEMVEQLHERYHLNYTQSFTTSMFNRLRGAGILGIYQNKHRRQYYIKQPDIIKKQFKTILKGRAKSMNRQALIEQLADKEHASWARWMTYLFSKCEKQTDGSLLIPATLVSHWEREIETPYSELPERYKQSDRNEVAHILPIIDEYTKDSPKEKPC